MENVILQPIEVGGQTFKNRIMFPPLTTGYEKNGMISEQDMGFPSCLTTARSLPSRHWPTAYTPTAPSWASSSSTRSTT